MSSAAQSALRKHRSSYDDADVRFSLSNTSSMPPFHASSSSSNTSSAASFRSFLATKAAEIEDETTQFLIDLKAKQTQSVLTHTLEMNNIKKQQSELELQREKEVLRHAQQLAESERAQNALVEKLEADIVYQNKAEVATRMIKSRQKRVDWLQIKEAEDLEEQRRRDTEEYEDYRQLKKLRAKRQLEREDAGFLFDQQQTLQRQEFDRELHRTVVLDTLRKGKHGEKNTRNMIETIFNRKDEKSANQDADAAGSEDEESVHEADATYRPFNPFKDNDE